MQNLQGCLYVVINNVDKCWNLIVLIFLNIWISSSDGYLSKKLLNAVEKFYVSCI
jgi:hypothetical protein